MFAVNLYFYREGTIYDQWIAANSQGVRKMKRIGLIALSLFISSMIWAQPAQPDSSMTSKVVVIKDPRLLILERKETEFNTIGTKLAKGYRLLVLKSNDRDYSMKVRSLLLQNFPDQKVYMTFQAPFIKLKFGNFTDKADAEKYRDMILRGKYVTNNIYVVPEVVEVKTDKTREEEE
ncbi:MAG: hypothetical protein IPP31_15235 [Chitinophagaceae bacterium]|nr:hypothetical protein [Chitinophagaceae bacterium]